MRFHSQNLNEKLTGNGSMWRHGRAWFALSRFEFRAEWSFGKSHSVGIGLDLADYDEDAIGGHISAGWLGAFYWGFRNCWLRNFMERVTSREHRPRELDQCRLCGLDRSRCIAESGHLFQPHTYWMTNGRNIGVRWFEGTLWIDLWNDPMEHRSSDPKWWHLSWNPADSILGIRKRSEVLIEEKRVLIPMPERSYISTIRIKSETWKRPRSLFSENVVRAHVDMAEGEQIPVPGKGENSWDCGEDATFSFTFKASTVPEAIGKVVESCMRTRIRHGGYGWVPEAAAKGGH